MKINTSYSNHEIKMPLNGILGIIEVLRETKLSEVQTELVKYIEAATNDLMSITNQAFYYKTTGIEKIGSKNSNN